MPNIIKIYFYKTSILLKLMLILMQNRKVSFLGIAGSETIDPIVLVNCGGNKKYSKVKKKDLNPVFN